MSSHPTNRRLTSRSKAKITKCSNGKWKVGNGACIHKTRAKAVTARG